MTSNETPNRGYVSDDDEIEIIEIVGMDDDEPTSRSARPSEPRREGEDDDEIELVFDERAEEASAPERGEGAATGGDAHETVDREVFLRLQAEFENFKKRVEREQDDVVRQASAGLVSELLAVLDNFERALTSRIEDGDGEAFRQGVSLIHRQMFEVLTREGLRPIEALETAFDPRYHEAVATEPCPEGREPNTVAAELQRGYLLHGRLLRPSLVRVRVDSEPASSSTDSQGDA